MNKRAIMLEFLVTVLLAIIIFAPACYVSAKFFRLSTQANENFGQLIEEIKNLPDNKPQKFVLIMDQGSFIAAFTKSDAEKKNALIVTSDYLNNKFAYPADKCNNKPCLCFCREYKKDETKAGFVSCNKLTYLILEPNDFSASWVSAREDADQPRRSEINLQKNGNLITISGGLLVENIQIGEGTTTHLPADVAGQTETAENTESNSPEIIIGTDVRNNEGVNVGVVEDSDVATSPPEGI